MRIAINTIGSNQYNATAVACIVSIIIIFMSMGIQAYAELVQKPREKRLLFELNTLRMRQGINT